MKPTVIAIGGNGFKMINQCFELCNTRFLINEKQLINEHSINQICKHMSVNISENISILFSQLQTKTKHQ